MVDWIEREDIRKEIRRELKEILRSIGFPDERLELFVRELIQLAEVQFKEK
jgi:type I restriction enzyme R subunit